MDCTDKQLINLRFIAAVESYRNRDEGKCKVKATTDLMKKIWKLVGPVLYAYYETDGRPYMKAMPMRSNMDPIRILKTKSLERVFWLGNTSYTYAPSVELPDGAKLPLSSDVKFLVRGNPNEDEGYTDPNDDDDRFSAGAIETIIVGIKDEADLVCWYSQDIEDFAIEGGELEEEQLMALEKLLKDFDPNTFGALRPKDWDSKS